ncbi:MAG: hypothetical protein ACUVSI_03200 [Actinomycetota bacterium]
MVFHDRSSQALRGRKVFILLAVIMTLVTVTVPRPVSASGNVPSGTSTGYASSPGSGAMAASSTSGEAQTWYLAEGYTGGEFDTYVLV